MFELLFHLISLVCSICCNTDSSGLKRNPWMSLHGAQVVRAQRVRWDLLDWDAVSTSS